MIEDVERMRRLAAEVEDSSRRLLETYEIRDAATRRELYVARRTAALVRGDFAAALELDRAGGAGAPSLATDLLVAALTAQAGRDEEGESALRAAVRERLSARGSDARNQVIALRRDLVLASSAFRLGEIAAFADPQWRRNPEVSQDFAVAMLRLWTEINLRNRMLPSMEAELVNWLSRHPASDGNIWAERDIGFDANTMRPVTIAVWDGVDPAVFAAFLTDDPQEQMNGRNDDADGFIDETEGLAFDAEFRPTTGILLPVPAGLEQRLAEYERYKRGVGDLAAGLDSPDVAFARAWRQRLTPADVEDFELGYSFYGQFIHGTNVASVALRGLVRANLVPLRITFSSDTPPPLLDEAAAERFVEMVTTGIAYLKSRGVRVCNISWGFTLEDIEFNLAQHGLEADPEARSRRAQRILHAMYAAMDEAIASAPQILFVVAAGNTGEDVDFVRDLPGSINRPNVLTVAAADEQGRATEFASTGASVDLYALGVNVEVLVPGGGRLRASGASLAAPQVVNAAAKLLAIEPRLSTEELVRLLIENASPAPNADLPLLNLRAARAALEERRH
ncbi:MAG: S8 family serine peptidase [Hyphomonadaceae bacterium]|nr:S8 family serine peptidase [Hyphomonadaceae bacterium]